MQCHCQRPTQPRRNPAAKPGSEQVAKEAVAGGEESAGDAKLVWHKSGMALSGDAGLVEVVGLETVDRDGTGTTLGMQEAEVRKAMKGQLVSKGWAEKDAAGRVKELRILTRREFDERQPVKE